uniref:Uncharacterized protein n=1 Tax=Schizaphis graminum TaxID=13262 RepID=A0A2S2NZC2_SCHGA
MKKKKIIFRTYPKLTRLLTKFSDTLTIVATQSTESIDFKFCLLDDVSNKYIMLYVTDNAGMAQVIRTYYIMSTRNQISKSRKLPSNENVFKNKSLHLCHDKELGISFKFSF